MYQVIILLEWDKVHPPFIILIWLSEYACTICSKRQKWENAIDLLPWYFWALSLLFLSFFFKFLWTNLFRDWQCPLQGYKVNEVLLVMGMEGVQGREWLPMQSCREEGRHSCQVKSDSWTLNAGDSSWVWWPRSLNRCCPSWNVGDVQTLLTHV